MQLLVFRTKFSAQHIPLLAEEGCPRHQKPKDPFRFVADGVVSSARLPRPAALTTNYGFALSRSRFAPVCAAFVASRHFLDGAATFEASRYRAHAPRPALRGGEYDAFKFRPKRQHHRHFGCGYAALSLLWFSPFLACKIAILSRMYNAADVATPLYGELFVFRSSPNRLVLSRRRALDVPRFQRSTSDRPLLHDGAALHHGDDREFPHRIHEGRFREARIDTAGVVVGRTAFRKLCHRVAGPVIEQ